MTKGYERDVFIEFFKKALEIGALLIFDKISGKAIGCTRFYNYNREESSVVIGQTFYAKINRPKISQYFRGNHGQLELRHRSLQ